MNITGHYEPLVGGYRGLRSGGRSATLGRTLDRLRERASPRRAPGEIPDQPFDRELLQGCPLYRYSRVAFVGRGGSFTARVASRQRALLDESFLSNQIEYSPIGRELDWIAATTEGRLRERLLAAVRPFATNVFHEQNHRVFRWSARRGRGGERGETSGLNLGEAVVIALDYALADALGPRLSLFLRDLGITYSPGLPRRDLPVHSEDAYRQYLVTAAYALWLLLDGLPAARIREASRRWPRTEADPRAVERALHLNRDFVRKTNRIWQARTLGTLRRGTRDGPPLWNDRVADGLLEFLRPFPLSRR